MHRPYVTIGNAPSDDVQVPSAAKVRIDAGFVVRDLGSLEGVYAGGDLLERPTLIDGNRIHLGSGPDALEVVIELLHSGQGSGSESANGRGEPPSAPQRSASEPARSESQDATNGATEREGALAAVGALVNALNDVEGAMHEHFRIGIQRFARSHDAELTEALEAILSRDRLTALDRDRLEDAMERKSARIRAALDAYRAAGVALAEEVRREALSTGARGSSRRGPLVRLRAFLPWVSQRDLRRSLQRFGFASLRRRLDELARSEVARRRNP
ncbi:MAG: FHA domain-containing protein [Planctomycetota bacterium]